MEITDDTIRAWIKALRSGEYKQGKALLNYIDLDDKETKHCCLGVLCDILEVPKTKEYKSDLNMERFVYHFGSINEASFISMRMENQLKDYELCADKLAEMNDSGVRDFKHIANYIQKKTRIRQK